MVRRCGIASHSHTSSVATPSLRGHAAMHNLLPSMVFLAFILFGCWSTVLAICPQDCVCQLDHRGRRQVSCDQGGMTDPIPILTMDQQIEVLLISAPEDNLNALTIGPIFQQFSQLEEIHIVRSNIPAVGKHSFWGVPTLHILNLTQNNISQILDHNFRGLANLLELHLDDNRIEKMPSGTFRHLSELRVLSLSKNRITELVPRLFLMLGKLHELDLSDNQLLELNPEVFKDVQELRVFRCRRCGLTNINTLIYRLLSDLLELDLGDNEFKYIASDEFRDLRKLRVLFLDGNQLPVVLEKTFGYVSRATGGQLDLQTLSLAHNRLAKVTATAFANLTTLKELDLSYNKLDRLETETFVPLADSLRRLELSGNLISLPEIKYVLGVVLKLKDVGLADMGLTDLPLGLFVYHEHIRSLNLSGNHFVHFPAQLLSPTPKLQILDLSRNQYRGLDERLLLRLETVKVVVLHGNPWSCDLCNIVPMLSRVNKTSSASMLRDVVCAGPGGLKGRSLASLKRSSLGWCTNRGSGLGYMEAGGNDAPMTTNFLGDESRLGLIAAGAAILLLLLTAALLLAGIAYSRHHAAQYYTNEEQRGPENEAIFENTAAMIGENGDLKYKIVPMEITKCKKKKVCISTIDGITKDPELHTLTNGT